MRKVLVISLFFIVSSCAYLPAYASMDPKAKIEFCKGIALEIAEIYTLKENGMVYEEAMQRVPELWDRFPTNLKQFYRTHMEQAYYGPYYDRVFEDTFGNCYARF